MLHAYLFLFLQWGEGGELSKQNDVQSKNAKAKCKKQTDQHRTAVPVSWGPWLMSFFLFFFLFFCFLQRKDLFIRPQKKNPRILSPLKYSWMHPPPPPPPPPHKKKRKIRVFKKISEFQYLDFFFVSKWTGPSTILGYHIIAHLRKLRRRAGAALVRT